MQRSRIFYSVYVAISIAGRLPDICEVVVDVGGVVGWEEDFEGWHCKTDPGLCSVVTSPPHLSPCDNKLARKHTACLSACLFVCPFKHEL